MQTKRWCVHFSDGTRLVAEAPKIYVKPDGALHLYVPDDVVKLKTLTTVLYAAPGQWLCFHAVGEDGCQVDRLKYELKRVMEGAADAN